MPLSFWIIASLTVISAIAAMTLRNLIHCALSLALAFIGMAGLFLSLNAAFVAFAQILVYVGAVAILIVFATLLTRNSETVAEPRASHVWLNLGVVALIAGLLLAVVASSGVQAFQNNQAVSVVELGRALMTSHIVPLELVGLLLTVALLGAVVIALPEKAAGKREES